MKTYKVLNLYACLGGNRYKWDESAKEAGVKLEVTAVELDPELARLYKERFPNDIVIVADANKFLLEHYHEFDFIWLSRSCKSHSRANFWASRNAKNRKKMMPDLTLYSEIIFLRNWFDGLFVAENVKPYYKPLLEPTIEIGRHLFWSNFKIKVYDSKDVTGRMIYDSKRKPLQDFHQIKNLDYKGEQRILEILRNLVDFNIGKHILDCALNVPPKRVIQSLFDETTIEI